MGGTEDSGGTTTGSAEFGNRKTDTLKAAEDDTYIDI
jgi:hypothetical protein